MKERSICFVYLFYDRFFLLIRHLSKKDWRIMKIIATPGRNFKSDPPKYEVFVLNNRLHVQCYGKHFKNVDLKALPFQTAWHSDQVSCKFVSSYQRNICTDRNVDHCLRLISPPTPHLTTRKLCLKASIAHSTLTLNNIGNWQARCALNCAGTTRAGGKMVLRRRRQAPPVSRY